jgi:hypothetical protein
VAVVGSNGLIYLTLALPVVLRCHVRGGVACVGLCLVVCGHAVRVVAFATAGSNFSHIIETGECEPAGRPP